MYLIDCNIFLEILLQRKNAEACRLFLEDLSEDCPGWVSSFAVHAIEAIYGRRGKIREIRAFLNFLEDHPYLEVYSTRLEEEMEVPSVMEKHDLDFDDAMQCLVAHNLGLSLVTFDRDFRKVKGLSVFEPQEIGIKHD